MTTADIEDYITIEKMVTSRTYASITDQTEIIKEMEKGPVYIIKKDGESIGMVSYEIKEGNGVYISGLSVNPIYQGQGIGKNALEKILQEVAGAPKVWLVTHPDNTSAVKLYQSLGFEITDRKENYFGDGEPRIVLTLK